MATLNNIINIPNYPLNINSWTSFPTTITAVTTSPVAGVGFTLSSYYLQLGKMLVIQMFFSQTLAGTSGSGIYLFNIPAGFTINTSFVPNFTTTANFCLGNAWTSVSNAGGVCSVIAYSSTNYALSASDQFGDIFYLSGGSYGDMSNAGANYSASFILPIV